MGSSPTYIPARNNKGAHRIDLGQKFSDLYRVCKTNLTIVDGIIGMEGQGPHAGVPIEMNLVIAGTDAVSTDAVTCYLMGFDPVEIPAIRCAANEDLGEIDLKKITVVGEQADSVRKIFKRPNDNPVGMYKGLTVYAQQTCPGCYVNVRGALDSFARSGISVPEFLKERGETVVVAGGLPDFDPQFAKGKHLFVCGDCWEYYPTADNIRQAAKVAKSVTYYPGCAPVYIFCTIEHGSAAVWRRRDPYNSSAAIAAHRVQSKGRGGVSTCIRRGGIYRISHCCAATKFRRATHFHVTAQDATISPNPGRNGSRF